MLRHMTVDGGLRENPWPRLMILLNLIGHSYADFEIVMVLARKFLTVLSTRFGVDNGSSSKRIMDKDEQHEREHEHEADNDGVLSERLYLSVCSTEGAR